VTKWTPYYSKKRPKVLRLHPNENGTIFQVLGGFRLVGFSQGIGFHVDGLGWRVRLSIRPEWKFARPHWYNYHVRWTGYNPPFDYISIHLAILRITIGPAYSGTVLLLEGDDDGRNL